MNTHTRLSKSSKNALHSPITDVDPAQRIEVTLLLTNKMNGAENPIHDRENFSRLTYSKLFGISEQELNEIKTALNKYNLEIVRTNVGGRTVVVEGTLADMELAFCQSLALCFDPHANRLFRQRSGELMIPIELKGLIAGVFGLDNRTQATPKFKILNKSYSIIAHQESESFNPPDLESLYGFPPLLDGSGQCVGIIELGGGYQQSELSEYFASLGLYSNVSVSSVLIDGAKNSPTTSDSADGEVLLDIEIIGALAPGCRIVVYFAPNTDKGFLDAITEAIHDQENNPSIISISWGAAESEWTQQALDAFNEAFKAASMLNVTVCAASGDNGSADNVSDGRAHVDFPASSPYVLACGGTSLRRQKDVITSEIVWNDGYGGSTGGGVSEYFSRPDYQEANNVKPQTVNDNPTGFLGRGLPDVAANADPSTGYRVLVDGEHLVIGGTSAVAPLMSALLARINQKIGHNVGFIHPLLYKSVCTNDIVVGDNDTADGKGYSAQPGWDACTGFGSPNGADFLQILSATERH